ncbi:hypothetical protein FOPE_11559 [Fonsecaea pedrosoi]|nr:hypothetical protein FOPE_11559 [Fonsecaea pedrosoi]
MTKRRTLPSSNPKFTWNVQDGSHSSFIAFDSAANGKAKNRRSAFTPQKIKDAAELRKRGACFKCKMWRKAVQLSVQSTSLHEVKGPFFEVGCCRYSPKVDDIVQREWGPETHQVLSIPTYCAFDLSALRSRLADIVDDYRTYQLGLFNQDAEEFPDIVIATLRVASRHEAKHPLLRAAVRLWMGARFLAAPRSLRGRETLGWEPIQDPTAHDKDYIPIPPMLDYQIDTCTINWMQEVTKTMLKELWKALLRKNKGDWFLVFLIIFVPLNTAEIAYEAQLLYVLEHGGAYLSFGTISGDVPLRMLPSSHSRNLRIRLNARSLTARTVSTTSGSWDGGMLELQQRQKGGSSTTEEAPVKQTSWCRQLLFGFGEITDEWPTRIAQQEHSSLD